MKIAPLFAAAALAATSAYAQDSTNATAYATGLLGALQQNNLTTLATLAQQNAAVLLPLLSSEGNKTVFAPTNEAFSSLSDDVTGNQTLVANLLAYHVYYGSFPEGESNGTTGHTILRSALNDSSVVMLPGGQGQVGVFTMGNSSSNSTSNSTSVTVLGPTSNVTSVATATYENLIIHVIPQTLNIPMDLSETVDAAGLDGLGGALTQYAPDAVTALEQTRGITVFAPVNSAFEQAASVIGTLNNTSIANVLLNHVINGSVVYSTQLADAVSAAGEQLTFMSNDTGAFVMTGNATAQIVRADIPIMNGVVHLIGSVLANTESDSEAAASAASSASSVAATQTSQATGAVGSNTGAAEPSSTSGGGNGGGQLTVASSSALAGVLALVGVVLAA